MSSLLAFDTATEHMSIALSVGERVWVHEGAAGAQASTTLIPAIQRLLAEAGITLRQLDAIAFGRGPGAFTGLRTACSVAQGLAFGADLPVVCIDTLQAVAEDARSMGGVCDVWVLMDARMEEIYAARYLYRTGSGSGTSIGQPGAWTTVTPPALYALDTLNAMFSRAHPAAVAGTAVEAFGERLQIGGATILQGALPRAAALIAIARCDWAAGAAVDAALALPLYVRDKVALTTVERDAVKAAKALATGTA